MLDILKAENYDERLDAEIKGAAKLAGNFGCLKLLRVCLLARLAQTATFGKQIRPI